MINPVYSQGVANRELLEDVLTEHDRVYEEIFARRKSSARSVDNVYSNIDNIIRKSLTVPKTSDLGKITENIEHETEITYDRPSAPYAVCKKQLNNRLAVQNDVRSSPQTSPVVPYKLITNNISSSEQDNTDMPKAESVDDDSEHTGTNLPGDNSPDDGRKQSLHL